MALGPGRRRSRSRKRCGGLSRRELLGYGLLGIGGLGLLSSSGAFTQVRADRTTSVGITQDTDALLGLDVVPSIQAGESDEPLVTVTNNAGSTLSVSVELDDPGQGSITTPEQTLAAGGSRTFSVSVSSDTVSGDDTLPFTIIAVDDESLRVSATRRVDVTRSPMLNRSIVDQSKNNNAEFQVSYQVKWVEDFDHIEVTFEREGGNLTTKSSTNIEGIFEHSDGGALGEVYEISFEVYDTSGSVVISDLVTEQADGNNPSGNDDMSDGDSPVVESFTVTDDTQNNNTDYTVNYVLSNVTDDNFDLVAVTFKNLPLEDRDEYWATKTKTSTSEPTGTVTYRQGDTEDDTYEITVEVRNQNGIVVNSESVTDVADGEDTSYPTEDS